MAPLIPGGPPMNDSATIPLRTVRALLRVVRDSGHSVEDALRQCQLAEDLPEQDIEGSISALAYSRLYGYVINLLQDESFGLNTRQKMPSGTFRMMCLFIIHCRTLGDAIQRAAEFFRYCSQFREEMADMPAILPGQDAGSRVIVLGVRAPSGSLPHISADSSMIYMMLNFFSWLIDAPLPVVRIWLAHPKPAHAERHESLFRAPLLFDADCNGIEVATETLDMPIAQNEDSLRDLLRAAPYPLIRPHNKQRRQNLTQLVRERLARNINDTAFTLDDIARQVGMTSRTIHRKLAQEGTTFRKLKESVLKETALHYLANPDLPIDAVATLMGFRESSAFYRSFKRWTGSSPGQYRQTQGISPAVTPSRPAMTNTP